MMMIVMTTLCINVVAVKCFGICSRQKLAASIKRYCLLLNVRDDNYLYNRIPFAISHAIDYHPRCDAINDMRKKGGCGYSYIIHMSG